jgi:hypothetical protein
VGIDGLIPQLDQGFAREEAIVGREDSTNLATAPAELLRAFDLKAFLLKPDDVREKELAGPGPRAIQAFDELINLGGMGEQALKDK